MILLLEARPLLFTTGEPLVYIKRKKRSGERRGEGIKAKEEEKEEGIYITVNNIILAS